VLDQRLLPGSIRWIKCKTVEDVARVIRDMAVRGAPAIGCVAAYGMVLALLERRSQTIKEILEPASRLLKSARPTAVNLSWAVDRMLRRNLSLETAVSFDQAFKLLREEAEKIHREDIQANLKMAEYGADLLRDKSVILTHCNAGALATSQHGTALGVIRTGYERGKVAKVFVDETRPYLQGSRLTAWELEQAGIPYEIITDNMAGHIMKTDRVSAVIVGTDRIAANGDVANKIGTYSLSILARHHKIPFYVAGPISSIDFSISTGDSIPIEERSSREVLEIGRVMIAPIQAKARHPAFDVTPSSHVTAIITERGVIHSPSVRSMRAFKRKLEERNHF